MVRCFDDIDIHHVDGDVNPLRDIETINTELLLKDIDTVSKHVLKLQKKKHDKSIMKELDIVTKLLDSLNNGVLALYYPFKEGDSTDRQVIDRLQLITSKKVLYICHVNEDEASVGNAYTKAVEEYMNQQNETLASINNKNDSAEVVVVSAKLEAESACFGDDIESQIEFLRSYNLNETGLNKVIRKCRKLLNIQDFYTVGPKESRAWTIEVNTKAPQAAAVIHSDFEKHFIRVEVISCNDYLKYGSEDECKRNNAFRNEGKEYVMQDGDVVHFLTSAK